MNEPPEQISYTLEEALTLLEDLQSVANAVSAESPERLSDTDIEFVLDGRIRQLERKLGLRP